MDPSVGVDSVVATSEVQASAKHSREEGDLGELGNFVDASGLPDEEVDVLGVLLDHVMREALAVLALCKSVQLELALEEHKNRLHFLLILRDSGD